MGNFDQLRLPGRSITVRESGRAITRRDTLRLGLATGLGSAMGLGGSIFSPAHAMMKMPVAQSGVTLFYLYLYVAMDEGLFKKEGLEIDLFTAGGGGGQPAVNALAARQAMCSTQDPVLCEAARQKGAKVKTIGALVNRMAVYIVGKKDIEPNNLSALKGRKIAILQRPNTAASIFNYLLANAGWKEEPRNNWVAPDGGEPLITVETRQGNQFPPLFAGAVDMAAGFEPGVSDAIKRGDFHLIWSFPDHFGEFLFSSMCAHDEDIEQKPDMLQAFMNGVAQSFKFVRTERKRTLEIAGKWFPQLDAGTLETAFDRFIAEKVYPERTEVTEAAWKANFENFLPFVNYPLNLPVDMAEVTNMEFARRADKKAGLT